MVFLLYWFLTSPMSEWPTFQLENAIDPTFRKVSSILKMGESSKFLCPPVQMHGRLMRHKAEGSSSGNRAFWVVWSEWLWHTTSSSNSNSSTKVWASEHRKFRLASLEAYILHTPIAAQHHQHHFSTEVVQYDLQYNNFLGWIMDKIKRNLARSLSPSVCIYVFTHKCHSAGKVFFSMRK